MANRNGAAEDEEDAALSAFQSFHAGLAQGRFTQLESRDDLWKLLVVITARKASAQLDRQGARKRGGGWTRIDAGHGDSAAGRRDDDVLAELAAAEPDPTFAAMVVEETRVLLDRLDDDGDGGKSELLFELLTLELEFRGERGEQPVMASFLARFPDHAGVVWIASTLLLRRLARVERRWELVRTGCTGVDLVLTTVILRILGAADSSLVVAYAMLIAASGLWNRVRLVWLTTALAMLGYSILATDAYLRGLPRDSNHHPDIILTALAVTGLIIAQQVRKVRALTAESGRAD